MLDKDLCRVAGIDEFLQYLMAELEDAEEILYNSNLSSSNYIHWRARRDTLAELRDKYCEGKNNG